MDLTGNIVASGMTFDFRNRARASLNKAKELLASGDTEDLEFAALKLRKAMEALTYERSKIYADDLGPKSMMTWQPKKLMDRMLEVDPYADKAARISIGREPTPGETPEFMRLLGTDNVLDMQTLKKHYDALGAYLHTETLDQIHNGKAHDLIKLRKRCDAIVEAVEVVLSSRIWNSSMANRGQIECHECGSIIRRRLGRDGEPRVVQCWECDASYTLTDIGNRKVHFEPRMQDVLCPVEGCAGSFPLWEREFIVGTRWKCRDCGHMLHLAPGVAIDENIYDE